MKLKYGTNDLWPTQVLKGRIDEQILEKVCTSIFKDVSLENRLHSFQKLDILSDSTPELLEFKNDVVIPAFEEYLSNINLSLNQFPKNRVKSWLTGNKNGYMIPIHNHAGASFSAVFYLFCEENDNGGELVAVDPRGNANRGYLDEFKPLFQNLVYQPTSGDYLIFPSYLYHHTNIFTGSLRLAMPVDLFL